MSSATMSSALLDMYTVLQANPYNSDYPGDDAFRVIPEADFNAKLAAPLTSHSVSIPGCNVTRSFDQAGEILPGVRDSEDSWSLTLNLATDISTENPIEAYLGEDNAFPLDGTADIISLQFNPPESLIKWNTSDNYTWATWAYETTDETTWQIELAFLYELPSEWYAKAEGRAYDGSCAGLIPEPCYGELEAALTSGSDSWSEGDHSLYHVAPSCSPTHPFVDGLWLQGLDVVWNTPALDLPWAANSTWAAASSTHPPGTPLPYHAASSSASDDSQPYGLRGRFLPVMTRFREYAGSTAHGAVKEGSESLRCLAVESEETRGEVGGYRTWEESKAEADAESGAADLRRSGGGEGVWWKVVGLAAMTGAAVSSGLVG